MPRVKSQKHIVLCHVSEDPSSFFKDHAVKTPVQWMFFGQDYLQYVRWQRMMPQGFDQIKISTALQKSAERLGPLLRDVITDLSYTYHSPAWWASRVSERNNLISPLFLYCCYLDIWQQHAKTHQGVIYIIGEDWALLESIGKSAAVNGFSVEWMKKKSVLCHRAQIWFKAGGRIGKFLLRSVMAKLAGPGHSLDKTNKKHILIHTYVDEACFKTGGVFSDRYFPGLAQWLEKKGHSVVTIPVLFNITRSYKSAWQWFRQSQHQFLNPYSLYQLSDYMFVLRESWRQRKMPEGSVMLGEMDVSGLFAAEKERYLFGCMDSLLYYRLARRIGQAGIEAARLIEVFENMIDEKMLISGFRQYSPLTQITGFQHGPLLPQLLCSFISYREAQIAPLPDKVICSGQLCYDVYKRDGFPLERLAVGPALRYQHLWDRTPALSAERPVGDILIVMPLMENDAVELLSKVLEAFKEELTLKIFVKPHPMMSIQHLMDSYFQNGIPAHFHIVQGEIREWLSATKVVIAMSSTAIIDVVMAGKPAIVVGRESAIDLNPLGFFKGLNQVFADPKDIRTAVLDLLKSPDTWKAYEILGKELLPGVFQPVTEDSMKVFIEE
jgi:hypothetical protein